MKMNPKIRYFGDDGRPTLEGLRFFNTLVDRLDGIAKVDAPTGGSTIDTQARDAINAIRAAAK